jgi:ABC-type bacteriocin/lantibiotic exporter with double-glycine peptidase domain
LPSAVSKYWDVNLPLAEAKEIAKKYQNVRGSILIEGIELAERHGLSSLILHSSLPELKKVIDMGIPPIVILPGLYEVVQHASVISGYDQKENSIIHYMPQPDQIGMIPQKQFDGMWEEDGRLAILVAPPDIISTIRVENKNKEKSNRLCFVSEKLNLQGSPI